MATAPQIGDIESLSMIARSWHGRVPTGKADTYYEYLLLTIEQQKSLMATEPACFAPAAGAWGRKGWTLVWLQRTDSAIVRRALEMAWCNTAPKSIAAQFGKN